MRPRRGAPARSPVADSGCRPVVASLPRGPTRAKTSHPAATTGLRAYLRATVTMEKTAEPHAIVAPSPPSEFSFVDTFGEHCVGVGRHTGCVEPDESSAEFDSYAQSDSDLPQQRTRDDPVNEQ